MKMKNIIIGGKNIGSLLLQTPENFKYEEFANEIINDIIKNYNVILTKINLYLLFNTTSNRLINSCHSYRFFIMIHIKY